MSQNCATVCSCSFGLANTGWDCSPVMGVTQKLIFVPYYDSTGVQNYMDLSTTLNQAYFTALINQSDATKRWYPTPEILEVKNLRGDPTVQDFANGSKIFVKQGTRNIEGMMVDKLATPNMDRAMNSLRCTGDLGVFLVTKDSAIVGVPSSDRTKLYPIKIDSGSLFATFMFSSDTETQALKFSFNWAQSEKDSCIGQVVLSEMSSDVTPLLWKGLVDARATFTSPATTGVTMKLYLYFGTAITPVPIVGLTASELVSSVTATTSKVRDTTGGSDLTVTCTESSTIPGTYALAYTATTAHVICIKPKRNGIDFTEVAASTVTTP